MAPSAPAGRLGRTLGALLDWAPGPGLPRSRAAAWVGILFLAGFSASATWVTLFGEPGAAMEATFAAYFAHGELPEGTPWIRQHFAWIFLPLLALAVAVRFGVTFFGTLYYEKVMGRPYPPGYVATMIGTNIVLFYLPAGVLLAVGVAGASLGLGDELASAAGWTYGLVWQWVPTLVTVPYPFPVVFAMIPGGLGYYWFHRLQHTWRPLWLLSHRAHHTMTHLAQPVALPASNPLAFFANTIPLALLIGTASKLFASEPMYLEAMIWTVVSHSLSEVFNHTEPVYRWTLGGRLRRFWFHLFGHGAWHQVHHSSAPEHRMVNLGGAPFMLWDRVFGTYAEPPPDPPPMGLTGRPALRWTPLRLALSGHLELVEDLVHNRSWRDRWRILFGPSSYEPPVASRHLLHGVRATRELG